MGSVVAQAFAQLGLDEDEPFLRRSGRGLIPGLPRDDMVEQGDEMKFGCVLTRRSDGNRSDPAFW